MFYCPKALLFRTVSDLSGEVEVLVFWNLMLNDEGITRSFAAARGLWTTDKLTKLEVCRDCSLTTTGRVPVSDVYEVCC